jgi:hypothetical protein
MPSLNDMATLSSLYVGQVVNVAARTGPGINQPGGVAKITSITADQGICVKYIIDSRQERGIDAQFVAAHHHRERLRDRSALVGRCTRCRSIRSDCGSCDFGAATEQQPEKSARPIRLDSLQSLGRPVAADAGSNHLFESETNSSEDTEELSDAMKRLEIQYERFKRKKHDVIRRKSNYLIDTSSDSTNGANSSVGRQAPQSTSSQPLMIDPQSLSQWSVSTSSDRRRRRKRQQNIKMRSSKRRQRILDDGDDERMSVSSQGSVGSEELCQDIAGHDYLDVDSDSMEDEHEVAIDSSPFYREDEGFIQPEGAAESLPVDIEDKTIGLEPNQLVVFFIETANDLETNKLPRANDKVTKLERQFNNMSLQSKQVNVDADTLRERVDRLYDIWYAAG